ncbi:MAG: MBL fold metallo-hydrolase [Kordiimonas sp.]
MKATTIYEKGDHKWVIFGRDPDRKHNIIDTNQHMMMSGGDAILMDPGGIELFAPMLAAVVHHVPIERIKQLFASHQDPDIISSLGLWDQVLDNTKLYAPWLWEGFIRHFGCEQIEYVGIPDEGMEVTVGNRRLQLVPAHYLHASGNYSVYDPAAKILMSGDIGAALLDDGASMFVEDFDQHTRYMKKFHQRWMPSNKAKLIWIERVRTLDVEMMSPQHGAIFRGDDVIRFLDWFEALDVGSAVNS